MAGSGLTFPSEGLQPSPEPAHLYSPKYPVLKQDHSTWCLLVRLKVSFQEITSCPQSDIQASMQTKSSHLTAAPNSMSDWSPTPQFPSALGLQHEPWACITQQQPCSYIARAMEMASSQGLACLPYLFRLKIKGHPVKLSCRCAEEISHHYRSLQRSLWRRAQPTESQCLYQGIPAVLKHFGVQKPC